MKILLACFSVTLVAPAWKFYLLPMAHHNGWEFGFVVDLSRLEGAQQHMSAKEADEEKFQVTKKGAPPSKGSTRRLVPSFSGSVPGSQRSRDGQEFSAELLEELLAENKALKAQVEEAQAETSRLNSSLNIHLGTMRLQMERMRGSISKVEVEPLFLMS